MKKWLQALVSVTLSCSMLMAFGCGEDKPSNDNPETQYYQNATYHWTQVAEDGSPIDFVRHTMVDSVCTICGYQQHFTVSFNTSGGSSVANQSLLSGEKAKKPADPTKADTEFCGWYTTADCDEPYDFNTPVTDNITIYAKWTTVFHFSFNVNGGTGNIALVTIKEGEAIPTIEQPTRDGYLFTGWYTHASTSRSYMVDFSRPLTEKLYDPETGKFDLVDCTLYAGWTTASTIHPVYDGDKMVDGGYYSVTGETEVTIPVHGNTFYFVFYPGGRSGVYTISSQGAPVKATLTSFYANPIAWSENSLKNTLDLTYSGNDFSYDLSVNNIYKDSPSVFAINLDGVKDGDQAIRNFTLKIERTADVADIVITTHDIHATATEKFTDNTVGKNNTKLLSISEGIYKGEDGRYYRVSVKGEKTNDLVYAVIGSPDGVENGFIEGKSIYQIPSLRVGISDFEYDNYRPMIEEYSGYEAYFVDGAEEVAFRQCEGGGLANYYGLYPLNDELLNFFKKYCALQGSSESSGAYLTFCCYQNK